MSVEFARQSDSGHSTNVSACDGREADEWTRPTRAHTIMISAGIKVIQ